MWSSEVHEPNLLSINGFVLENTLLPEEVLSTILSFTNWEDLKACRLVCNSWRSLVDYDTCYEKLKREYNGGSFMNFTCPISKLKQKNLPFYIYYAIGQECFGTNLLRNVFGSGADPHKCDMVIIVDDGGNVDAVFDDVCHRMICSTMNCPKFKYWELTASGGEGWIVEDVAEGSDPVPEHLEEGSCFVTSYYTCFKHQCIDLKKRGLTPKIMDEIQPIIEVTDWYAARYDCGSLYRLRVALLSAEREPIDEYKCGKNVHMFLGGQWNQVTHTFKNYGPGVRYILFEHGGEDTDWIGGHSGVKLTGSSVVARLPSEIFDNPWDLE